MKDKKIVYCVVSCVVCLVIGFFGGMQYKSGKSSSFAMGGRNSFIQGGMTSGQGANRMGRGGGFGGVVSGEILSKDDQSITVKLRDMGNGGADAGSKIVFYSPSTQVSKTVDGSSSDLVVGKQVVVMGTPNTDGSVNATSVQVRPQQTSTDAKK